MLQESLLNPPNCAVKIWETEARRKSANHLRTHSSLSFRGGKKETRPEPSPVILNFSQREWSIPDNKVVFKFCLSHFELKQGIKRSQILMPKQLRYIATKLFESRIFYRQQVNFQISHQIGLLRVYTGIICFF
jgi:hypothetical protein